MSANNNNQRPGSYPSPNAAQVSSGVPFFNQSSSAAQDVPAMQELSAELSRALNSDMQQQQQQQQHQQHQLHHPHQHQHQHDDGGVVGLQQQIGPPMPGLDLQQQLAQDAMGQLGGGGNGGGGVQGGVQEYEEEEDELSEGGTLHKRKKQKLLSSELQRQKNTRACDACRRKKVKCESEIGQELGIEACLACKKSGLQCQFSRVPQKRGPSKGYISKLDERLRNVENAIRDYVPQAAYRIGRPDQDDPSAYDIGDPDDTPQAHLGPSGDAQLDYGRNGDNNSFWNHTSHMTTTLPDLSAVKAATSQDLNEGGLTECYDILQAILPILSADPLTQRRMLGQVSPSTRSAFATALNCFVRSMGSDRASVSQAELKTASQLCLEADFEASSTTKTLVLIQTYLLLSLTAEELGPGLAHAGSATSSQKLLSQANNLALGLDIHRTPDPKDLTAGHGDTESKIARRLFVSLYILDRWLAIGYATPFRINLPDDRLILLPEDQSILGQQCYQLARISTLLTQISKTLPAIHSTTTQSSTSPSLTSTHRTHLADIVQTVLDRIADDTAPFITSLPTLHAALLHAEMLVHRLRPLPDLPSLTDKAARLIHALGAAAADAARSTGGGDDGGAGGAGAAGGGPLAHHFAALCGLSLAEVVLIQGGGGGGGVQEEEDKGVVSAVAELGALLAPRPPRDGSWEATITNLVDAAAHHDAVMGLHNLADAAVTGAAVQALQQQQADGFDMVRLVGAGYLSLLVPKS